MLLTFKASMPLLANETFRNGRFILLYCYIGNIAVTRLRLFTMSRKVAYLVLIDERCKRYHVRGLNFNQKVHFSLH